MELKDLPLPAAEFGDRYHSKIFQAAMDNPGKAVIIRQGEDYNNLQYLRQCVAMYNRMLDKDYNSPYRICTRVADDGTVAVMVLRRDYTRGNSGRPTFPAEEFTSLNFDKLIEYEKKQRGK